MVKNLPETRGEMAMPGRISRRLYNARGNKGQNHFFWTRGNQKYKQRKDKTALTTESPRGEMQKGRKVKIFQGR